MLDIVQHSHVGTVYALLFAEAEQVLFQILPKKCLTVTICSYRVEVGKNKEVFTEHI